MKEVFSILFGAGFTVAVCLALGSLLLSFLRIRLHRTEAALIGFIAGAGVLSFLVTMLCLMQEARKGVFLWGGLAAIVLAWWRRQRPGRPLTSIRLDWLIPFAVIVSAFFIYYFINALAPEVSPDGSGYHLGNVARIWRHHGFVWDFRSLYSYLSQGMEMLFLVAFSFGRHSAAAMVHSAFLCALPLLVVCYGRRFGFPMAGLFAALLVFVAPVAAKSGVSAYNDLAVATLAYAVFYLIQVWEEENDDKLLILIGLLAGFAYAVKYTAFLTLPYAVATVWFRRGLNLRAFLYLALPAALLAGPWVLRNWIWVGNPAAPFLNAWFPNPYFHPGMERIYVAGLSHYTNIKNYWQIPLELTLRGGLIEGSFGPVFLMLPLSLLALRYPQGRRLLLTGLVFAVPAYLNTGARFLIPAMPFFALAVGVALSTAPAALAVLGLFQALTCWPSVLSTYCDPWTWRIGEFPKSVALRQEPATPYIQRYLTDYALKAPIELHVPPHERVFSFAGRRDAYLDRDIIVSYESTLANQVFDILWAPAAHPPTFHQRYRFLPVTTRALRVVNNTSAEGFWTVAEMRVFSLGKEIPRDPAWKISAWPNGWEVPLAFDNNYATRWSTWQAMGPRNRIQIDFPAPVRVDEAVLECDPAWEAKLEVQILLPSGRWVPIADTMQLDKVEPPEGMRRAATRAVQALGLRFLLVNEGDFVYADFKKNSTFWGITQLAEVNGTHFYRID